MLKTWSKFEKIWLVLFLGLILVVTVIGSLAYTDYSSLHSVMLNWLISPLSAITGIICVVLVARGSKWNYLWGLINAITYGYVAYFSGYYGDAILNIFFFLPTQFIGYYMWSKRLRTNSNEFVQMKKLTVDQGAIIALISVLATVAFGAILSGVDNWFITAMKRNVSIYNYIDNVFHIPFLGAIFDSSTEVLQIVAQILMLFAYSEQWLFWIATNVITIIMWTAVIISDPTTAVWVMPILIMWIGYLVNSVYGYANWIKGAKEYKQEEILGI